MLNFLIRVRYMINIKSLIPNFALNWYHFALAFVGAFLYGFPSRKLVVIGVTGTNGKSTVVEMCHQIFKEAGFRVASLSSVRFNVNGEVRPNLLKITMPGRFRLQKFLRDAVAAGCKYAVLEVTSEGIKQHRHKFIDFDAAVFTNLTPEHIESHGSFEAYKKAKGELFRSLAGKNKNEQYAIVNLDDPNAEYFLGFPANKIGYTLNSEYTAGGVKSIKAEEVKNFAGGSAFSVEGIAMRVKLPGEFNVSNALAAIGAALSQGVDFKTIGKALENIQSVPGRMEVVSREPFTVIVDYAHTPDALEKVYSTVKNLDANRHTINGKMICVLGAAGGGRDKWKRPELGKIAARFCDQIILTDEDPYDEDPVRIVSQIKEGIAVAQFSADKVLEILDRREAIRKALALAAAGDAVIITGKGSEPWMCVAGGKKIAWDDRMVAEEALKTIVR